MNETFLDRLFSFLATPYGIIGIALGVLMIIKASSSRSMAWFIFSLFCFASSLSKFQDQWIKEPPPLLFPLQQIRDYGRPLAIILLISLVYLALQTQVNWRQKVFPNALKYLIIVQFIFFLKTLLYGNFEIAILSAITFGGIIFMLRMGPGRWLNNDENFNLAVRSVAIAGLIFVVPNTYQYVISPYAVTFSHNRFMGTTGNPQHAAVLLAVTLPCLIFLIQTSRRWSFSKLLWVSTLTAVMYFIVLTGSRTGLLMTTTSILLFYRNNRGAWFRLVLLVFIFIALILPFFDPGTLSSSLGINSSISNRFTSPSNTREGVWSGMWNSLMDNILFGSPLQGGRMGYGENSWLAVGSNLGLVGFIPMIMMGWKSLKLIWQLNKLSNRDSYYFFQTSVVIAGLGSMLVGSFFEAFLMGTITFPQIIFLTYLIMSSYLLEVDRVRSFFASRKLEFTEHSRI
jgi:hypothetical protein